MIIWWYLAKHFLKTLFSMTFFSLSLFFLLTYIEENSRYFPKYNLTFPTIIEFYFWQIPSVFLQFLPFLILTSSLIGFWVFAKHGEIAALRAAGMSLFRVASPYLSIAMLLTVTHFVINDRVVPYTQSQWRKVVKQKIEKESVGELFTKAHWLKAKNSILYYGSSDEEKQTLENIEYFLFNNDSQISQIAYAKQAYFNKSAGVWILEDAKVLVPYQFGSVMKLMESKVAQYATLMDFDPPKVLQEDIDSNQLGFFELLELIRNAKQAGTNVSDREVDLQLKLSLPFANILFIFLTIPFALRKERQGDTYKSIVICFAAALIYWFGNLAMRNIAVHGSLNPVFAAWFMNIVLGAIAIFHIRKLDRGI